MQRGKLRVKTLFQDLPRFLFFTGKGGVGKTSLACATAVGLADHGKKVLLVSTDPASNLDEILATPLGPTPREIPGVPLLRAMNINPLLAAAEYRERMVGPYRGILPDAIIQQMEEQLSGACTVEIAGFNEFAKSMGEESLTAPYDHIVLDTAPTGHTLRLLNLPAAWTDFLGTNQTGSSCLGPVSGLTGHKALFERVVNTLSNPNETLLVLVARAEDMSLREAERTSCELRKLSLTNQHLVINGLFLEESEDPIAHAFVQNSRAALRRMPPGLAKLAATHVRFRPRGVTRLEDLRELVEAADVGTSTEAHARLHARSKAILAGAGSWDELFRKLEETGRGVIMTMGKGGVGKTTIACMIAAELVRRGHSVLLSTTDPAAHLDDVAGTGLSNLTVARVDPKSETAAYVENVLARNRPFLGPDDLALLEEELRSPCIEEIAVFHAFARVIAAGREQFVVLDTAPTGHTLLLMDSTEAYHREVAKSGGRLPEEVRELLPRLRDPDFTRTILVALPEATPTHEAAMLQSDLQRAGIKPLAWVVNRCFVISGTRDPSLCAKSLDELVYIEEILRRHAQLAVLSPWHPEPLCEAKDLGVLQMDLGAGSVRRDRTAALSQERKEALR